MLYVCELRIVKDKQVYQLCISAATLVELLQKIKKSKIESSHKVIRLIEFNN